MTNDKVSAQNMLHRMIVDFTTNELAPLDMKIDQLGDYPDGLFQKVIDNGLLGITLPREYGGAGFNYVATAQAINAMAFGNASMAVTLEGHFKTLEQLLKYGQPELLKKIFTNRY